MQERQGLSSSHPAQRTLSPGLAAVQRFIVRFQLTEEYVLILTAVLVGVGAGVGAVLFRWLIRAVEWIGYDWFPALTAGWGRTYVVLVPAFGGLLVGLLVYHFAREAKGHGVPEVMEAVALRGGRIRPIVAVIKSLASSLCIGSGGSVGREGPIVQIGAALGSTVGQIFNLSDDRIRNLVACGAAGGIAATFNAPIAGVIFALEVILGEFSVGYFSTVVISSVTASVIGQAAFGDAPAFPVPIEYHIASVWEFALYPVLGVLAALVAVAFVRSLYWAEDRFEAWRSVPEWVQPAIGGGLLGVLALAYPSLTGITWTRMPQIFNVGYDVIEATLANQGVFLAAVALLVLKMVATSLTLGSGGSGGVFAPSLFMGAMLGAAFGLLVNGLFPGITAPPGAYALVGMAAVFAGGAHAPMTAILILFELTGDYRIILPLMFTTVVATLVARRLLHGESIYTLKLTRRGIHLHGGMDVDVMHGVLVGDVMTREVDAVFPEMTIVELSDAFRHSRYRGFPVLDEEGRLWGVVTVTDLEAAVDRNLPRTTKVSEIGTPFERLVIAYPDETIGDVLLRMGPRGLRRLPVVSRDDPRRLVGLISRVDIIRAYSVALTHRAELQHRVRRLGMRAPEHAEYLDFILSPQDYAVGRTPIELRELMPTDCILVSIERHGQVIIPHGHTVLQAGDRITVFTRSDVVGDVLNTLRGAHLRQPAPP